MTPLAAYLTLSAMLFAIGLAGALTRRNSIMVLIGIELMLNAANLALVAFSRFTNNLDGQVFVFFVMVVAAAESAVGLAIIIAVYRTRQTLNVDQINLLKL